MHINVQNSLYMYLSFSFQCVQEDCEIDIQVVLLKKQEYSRNYSKKAKTANLDRCSMPVDLSRFNEP